MAKKNVTAETHVDNGLDLEVLGKVSKGHLEEIAGFTRQQAMALVSMYYATQKVRIGSGQRIDAEERNRHVIHDTDFVKLMKGQLEAVEKNIAKGLRAFVVSSPLGRWMMQVQGMGEVIAAGLMAHIDLSRACYPSSIYKFAGLMPKELIVWEKGTKRPYNARLKNICWKLGESFKKSTVNEGKLQADSEADTSRMTDEEYLKHACSLARRKAKMERIGEPEFLYARLYLQRKKLEVEANERGDYADQAQSRLADAKKHNRRVSPEQVECWSQGKLQRAGLDLRAARYAVKIFLSHYFEVGREVMGLPRVLPWVLDPRYGGHSDYIPVPCWPMK